MVDVTRLKLPIELLGSWRAEWDSDDGRSEYHIGVVDGRLNVTGKDYGDGEEYSISNVMCSRSLLTFNTLMPSTGRQGHLTFFVAADGEVHMLFTFTEVCLAVKVPDER